MNGLRPRHLDVVRRLRLRGLLVVTLAAGLAIPGAAAAGLSVRVTTPSEGQVAFRFSGLPPCEAVVSNARVLAWLGPQVDIVVRGGTKVVARGAWEACKDPPRAYQPWDVRPKASKANWSAAARASVLTLTAAMPRPGLYRYAYTVSVNGNRVRSGRIRVAVTAPSAIRITLT